MEQKIINSSICKVTAIVYDDTSSSKAQGALPLYVVVDFSESALSYSLIPGISPTYITIPITTERCEKSVVRLQQYS